MRKICQKCDEEKEIEKFVKEKDKYRNYCKECRNKARRTGNPIGNKGVFRSRKKGGRFYYKFREEILARDGYKCVRCGNDKILHAHHIIPWNENEKLRYEPSNLVTLCDVCHAIVEPKLPTNHIPWNKGKKNVYSENTLNLWSEKRKGKPSWNTGLKGYRAGEKRNPHTEETKMKIKETKRLNKEKSNDF